MQDLHNAWKIIIFSRISRKTSVKSVHNSVVSPTFHEHSHVSGNVPHAIRDIPDKPFNNPSGLPCTYCCLYYTHARVHYRSNSEISGETVNIIITRRVSEICMYVYLCAGFLLSIRWFKYHLSNVHRLLGVGILVAVSRSSQILSRPLFSSICSPSVSLRPHSILFLRFAFLEGYSYYS